MVKCPATIRSIDAVSTAKVIESMLWTWPVYPAMTDSKSLLSQVAATKTVLIMAIEANKANYFL